MVDGGRYKLNVLVQYNKEERVIKVRINVHVEKYSMPVWGVRSWQWQAQPSNGYIENEILNALTASLELHSATAKQGNARKEFFGGIQANITGGASEWRQVVQWAGSGVKNTETFTINTRQWRVSWNYSGSAGGSSGVFYIQASKEDGSWSQTVADQTGQGANNSVMRSGPGDHYLQIVSNAGSWIVRVEEKK